MDASTFLPVPTLTVEPASLDAPDAGRRTLLRAAMGLVGTTAGLGLVGCGGGGGSEAGGTTDALAPQLVATSPRANATGVSRTTSIELDFSETVSVPQSALTLTGPRGAVPFALTTQTSNGSTRATLQLTRPLGFGERYTVGMGSSVRDAAGNALAPVQQSFTTQARNTTLALGGIIVDTYVRRRFADPATNPFNALPALVDHGFEWLRAATTTHSWPELRSTSAWHTLGWRNEYWSCLEASGALMREAADLGMRLHSVLFLSDMAAHWGQQRLPAAWQGLSPEALASAVEEHARTVATYYRSLGLNIEVFELGNEIDAGAFGLLLWDTVVVPPGVDALNDPAWMRANLWSRVAPLLRAAGRGVKAVYPQAKLMLHVGGFGYSRDELAASAFFESMAALEVPFDLAGLSFPYMTLDQGLQQPFFGAPAFLAALDRIALLGRPIQIVEVGYNAKPEGTAVANPAYPYTPQGQADFFRDMARAISGRVQSLIAFYPDWYDGMDAKTPELEGMGMFSGPGVPRPVLSVFNSIAENGPAA